MLRRFLLPRDHPSLTAPATTGDRDATTDDGPTVRRIVGELQALPHDRARYLAGFAYILGRAAFADLDVSELETSEMERIMVDQGGLTEAQAVLVVETARTAARLVGATEDYLVTRAWSEVASEEQKLAVIRCCFEVGAADASVSAEENAAIKEIAFELDIDDRQLNQIREEFHDKLSSVQAIRRQREAEPPVG
jgi:uncharacterized tellurite resistance protein B-like protein